MHRGHMRALRLLVSFCAITLTFQPAGAQDYITLTNGGGVTGNTTIFRISTSGEVAKGTGSIEPAFSEFAQLRKGKTRKYFRKTRALMKAQAFNHPGNIYTAIALTEAGKEGKLVWGDGAHATPVEAEALYQKILESLNRLTFHKDLRK
jgi:hypothetical protein